RRGDTDDRVELVIEPERPSHDAGIAAEGALPETVGEDDTLRLGQIFLAERPAERRAHAQRSKIAPRDGAKTGVVFPAGPEAQRRAADARRHKQAREGAAARAELPEERVADRAPAGAADLDQLL